MADNRENDIREPNVILCEGLDAKLFLIRYLELLKQEDDLFNTFWVHNFGGITQLSDFLKTFCMQSKFKNNVHSLCVIRDSEKNSGAACQSIADAFNKNHFLCPPRPCEYIENINNWKNIRTGFVLFPTISNRPTNGTLEDLCIKILSKADSSNLIKKGEKIINEIVDESGLKKADVFPHIHKNVLDLYFAMTDEFVFLKIGEASRAGAFNFNSMELNPLKDFLRRISF